MPTPDEVRGLVKSAKADWKSVVSLLLAILFFIGGVTWMLTGYIVKGADAAIKSNAAAILAVESRQTVLDTQVLGINKRHDEVLVEVRAISGKLNSVAESQARMEGVLLGTARTMTK